jgi:hypothetical protein
MVLASILNYRRLVKLTIIDQFIMAFGGLPRGRSKKRSYMGIVSCQHEYIQFLSPAFQNTYTCTGTFGGLRGGIAFCLALSLKEDLIPERKLFITATIVIIFFTVFVQVKYLMYCAVIVLYKKIFFYL